MPASESVSDKCIHRNLEKHVRQSKCIIKIHIKEGLKVVNTRARLLYYASSVEIHRKLKTYLEGKNRQYYNFQARSDLPLWVMVKRLPTDAKPEEINAELLELGYAV